LFSKSKRNEIKLKIKSGRSKGGEGRTGGKGVRGDDDELYKPVLGFLECRRVS
jgi:hypothetical protein